MYIYVPRYYSAWEGVGTTPLSGSAVLTPPTNSVISFSAILPLQRGGASVGPTCSHRLSPPRCFLLRRNTYGGWRQPAPTRHECSWGLFSQPPALGGSPVRPYRSPGEPGGIRRYDAHSLPPGSARRSRSKPPCLAQGHDGRHGCVGGATLLPHRRNRDFVPPCILAQGTHGKIFSLNSHRKSSQIYPHTHTHTHTQKKLESTID